MVLFGSNVIELVSYANSIQKWESKFGNIGSNCKLQYPVISMYYFTQLV